MSLPFGYTLVEADETMLPQLYALEVASFPADEAAAEESMRMRIQVASCFFQVLLNSANKEIVGFVNGTCIAGEELHHDCMTSHVPEGTSLVIHSVTIAEAHRRKGLGAAMLNEYLEMLKIHFVDELDCVLLLCKPRLIAFYIACGFAVTKMSDVQHGSEQWLELRYSLIESRRLDQITVDAFSSRSFGGNPAAVVFLNVHAQTEWMQALAAENNLAETAFLHRIKTGTYDLRWFTPTCEVDLCGHATVAAAAALFETKRERNDQLLSFHTKSGVLTACRCEDGDIQLDFPSTPPRQAALTELEQIALLAGFKGLKAEDILYTGRTMFDLLVEITLASFNLLEDDEEEDDEERKGKLIDVGALAAVQCRGIILTCQGASNRSRRQFEAEIDFSSRFFGPNCGVPEDPVTGSAHCALAPHYFNKIAAGKEKGHLTGYQASTRGGVVKVRIAEDEAGSSRVKLTGPATIVAVSKLYC